MERKQMKDFMNVCDTGQPFAPSLPRINQCLADVLEPRPTMLHGLRQRFHIQELTGKGGRMRNEMCG